MESFTVSPVDAAANVSRQFPSSCITKAWRFTEEDCFHKMFTETFPATFTLAAGCPSVLVSDRMCGQLLHFQVSHRHALWVI
jgi:hypothetical protein